MAHQNRLWRLTQQPNRPLGKHKREKTAFLHYRTSLRARNELYTMLLSRARPLALRTLRQQRALSAAPQPKYEEHVARTSVQIKSRPPTPREEQIRDGVGGRIFQNQPPRLRRDARTARRCPTLSPRRPNSSTPPPHATIAHRLTYPRKRRSPSRRSTRTAASWSTPWFTRTAP